MNFAALFLIVLRASAPATDVPVEIAGVPVEAGIRMELLQRSDGPPARWVRADGGSLDDGGTATVRGMPGRDALLILRGSASRTYRLDGPFAWPASPGSRTFRGETKRTLQGSNPAATDLDFRLIGAGAVPDPLCDTDGVSEWRCLGVPADFSGRIVACADGRLSGAAPVRPDSGDETSLRLTSPAVAAFRVEASDSSPLAAGARVLRPVRAGGLLLAPDPGARVASLGEGIQWVEAEGSTDRVIELRAAGHATRQVPFDELPSACGGPSRVALSPAIALRGNVSGPDGQPVAAVTVLARSEEPAEDPRVFGDATTDDRGDFALDGLESRVYRVLACHGELGCRDERSTPGDPDLLRIVLGGAGAFAGRAVSSVGVPEVDATVRIVPTADAWAASRDRVRKLPLQTTSGRDGRFRIAAPEPGDFLVEVRGASGGVARTRVRRTNLSPPVTDLGDLRLPEPIRFTARVRGCGLGWLTFSGPLGGETSLPEVLRFRLDSGGVAAVGLGEPGAWTAWATCGGENERVEPAILPDVRLLDGFEVGFERAGTLADSP